MSILTQIKSTLENVSPIDVYLEYDSTSIASKGERFVLVGISSSETSYDIQNSTDNFSKDTISISIKVVMPSNVDNDTINNYFDNYIMTPLMKSTTFNILSVKKDTPQYTKYLNKLQLDSTILLECLSNFD